MSVFKNVQSGVLESYYAVGCSMLPANKRAAFRNVQVFGPTFNQLSPAFYVWQPNPQCSMKEQFTASSADIIWS
jgi:hypothetical protein